MSLLVVTDTRRGRREWPVRFRGKGYQVESQEIGNGGLVLDPYAGYAVILFHFTNLPAAQALAAVRMFHTCYAGARIVVIADLAAQCRAFQEAGATVHLAEPVEPSLVFTVVEMLTLWVQAKRAARKPALRLVAEPTAFCATVS
ncbi:MAG TPA: hypothetical protein PLD73_02125 [Candidatus Hydrogenedentes bacterium]|jgi:hypothetical protein|nr:hypothetical protein [Candidatus Hydrogenedentota bacterium]HPJ99313.1 hypothetical protein [Candidatus Hydrogenedentota bacterium]